MATMQINHMCFLTSLFLFAFSVTNAIPRRDIENLCRETSDAAFCIKTIESDPRIAAARDLSDVLVIVITLSKMQVDDATTHLNSVRRKFNGVNGKRRIDVCTKNYGTATARFQTAWEMGLKKSYLEVKRLATVGTNAVMDCENVWKRGGPIQKSPLTLYNMNVSKLSGVILLLIRKLGA